MLVFVMDYLDQLVPRAPQPEQRGNVLQVDQSMVELQEGSFYIIGFVVKSYKKCYTMKK